MWVGGMSVGAVAQGGMWGGGCVRGWGAVMMGLRGWDGERGERVVGRVRGLVGAWEGGSWRGVRISGAKNHGLQRFKGFAR